MTAQSYNEHLAAKWPIGGRVSLKIGLVGWARGDIIEHSVLPAGGPGLLLHIRMTEDMGDYCHVGDIRTEAVGMAGGSALSGPATIANV